MKRKKEACDSVSNVSCPDHQGCCLQRIHLFSLHEMTCAVKISKGMEEDTQPEEFSWTLPFYFFPEVSPKFNYQVM